jgi:flagellar biosynthesis protein FlhF
MQYFTLQAYTLREAVEKMKRQYGDKARILTHREIHIGGFLGLFARDGIEVTGYLSNEGNGSGKVRSMEEEKKKIIESAKKEQSMNAILKEIQELKSTLSIGAEKNQNKHPTISRIEEILFANDFTSEYVKKISQRLQSEFSLTELSDFDRIQGAVLLWIGDEIEVYSPFRLGGVKPTIYIVVGPTGVGKTTTIAKLAAIYGIGKQHASHAQVRMITIDNYRIAAKKQIETYADIMQIPVTFAETYNDLVKAIALYQDVDLILIDTIGKSPSDFEKLAEMRRILGACGNTHETHVAVSATTKASDIEEVLRQFEPFAYKSVIVTKLDETSRIGNVVSVLANKGKPVSFITDGQVVPQDIQEANALVFLNKIEGLRVGRDLLEKRYSSSLKEVV